MVTYNHTGRLGNVLFIAAAAIAYAEQHEMQFHPLSYTHNSAWFPVYLQHLKNPRFDYAIPTVEIYEKRHCFDPLPFEHSWRGKNVRLNGYFQTEKYFENYRELVKHKFDLPPIKSEGWVGIHVRRGDYLKYPTKHPVVTMEYIVKAVEQMNLKGYHKFKVFGDDIVWNRMNINKNVFPGCEFEYSYQNELVDLRSLAGCDHQIISNSSFAWWGAWLNDNPEKFIICPHEDNHFGPDNKHLDVSDFYPPSWHRIKYAQK